MAATEAEATGIASELLRRGIEPLVERCVPIEREVAILVARDAAGATAIYPLVETVQADGMCREVLAPAPVPAALAESARALAQRVAELCEVVGILALELFVSDGRLLINEIATRPHNSGHYSIEACVTSQFEQHLRAVAGLPLGLTELVAPVATTVNIVGAEDGADPRQRLPSALAIPGAHVHLYGKEPRPGRKLGHVTTLGSEIAECRSRAHQAVAALTGGVG
jgi:5-(carboxyamino)imidazole ribonucleotide synthase